MKRILGLVVIVIMVHVSFAQKLNLESFNSSFKTYNYQECKSFLELNQSQAEGRDRLLWYLSNGIVTSYTRDYKASNEYFLKARQYFDEIKLNIGKEAVAYMLNATKRDYRGEDSEQLMVHYFLAYNYLHLNKANEALNELSAMELVLKNLMEEDHKGKKDLNKLAITYLMKGVAYEMDKDYLNAFTSYKMTHEIYERNYSSDILIPNQLKRDIVRTAKLSNSDELAEWETKLNLKYDNVKSDGNVIAFWNNGLGPVKRQLTLNYTMSNTGNGMRFVDARTGESFPLAAGAVAGVSTLMTGGGSVKMAYPKYNERPVVFDSASIIVGNTSFSFEQCENVSALAVKSLKARKNKEMGEMIARFAVKNLAKAGAKKLLSKGLDQAGLGALSGLANKAVDKAADKTERADLRHWGTMPHSIYYTRISLTAGKQKIAFNAAGKNGKSKELNAEIVVNADGTQFIGFATHESFKEIDNTPAYASTTYAGIASTLYGNSGGKKVNRTLYEPLPLLTEAEYSNYVNNNKMFFTQVVDGDVKELKHGFRKGYKEHLTLYYPIIEDKIGVIEDKVYLEVIYSTEVRNKILKIKNVKLFLEEAISADLKATIYPNLTKNESEAKYRLVINIDKLNIRNNHFMFGVMGPSVVCYPCGLPMFEMNFNANLYTGESLLGESTSSFRKQTALWIYGFNRQIGRPTYKNKLNKLNPMEQGLQKQMGELKTELYQMHSNSASK